MKEGAAGDHMYIIASGTCMVIKVDSTLLISHQSSLNSKPMSPQLQEAEAGLDANI
jgi:hypothetical protein